MKNQVPLFENECLEKVNDELSLISNKTFLRFGTDALFLAYYLPKAKNAAELGAGNGIVSLLAAKRGRFEKVIGFELQKDCADLFERNIALNGLDGVVTVEERDIREIKDGEKGKFDCVFSNPPYMKTEAGKECAVTQKQAARHETAGGISDFCRAASLLLRYGGEVCFVYRPDRLCDLFCAMRENGIEPKRMTAVCADHAHAPSMVLVSGKKGGKSGLVCTPDFFIEDGNGSKTDEYIRLMKEGCFNERCAKRGRKE